ncbi:MAG: DNA repair protein RecO [Kiritimatiellae bacterium]|nr:DNA repair protein RecO [Kiritimatiellia bacterium]
MKAVEKCEAIVLQVSPYSRTSHLVTWLSADHGRFLTLVKGACRPRSVFLGQYDLFYTCELLFYPRTRESVFIAKECTPLITRTALRTGWRAATAAQYMAALASEFGTPGSQPQLYALLSACLDALCTSRPGVELLLWFELKLAQILGFSPRFLTCVSCNAPVDKATHAFFSPVRGGTLCQRCVVETSSSPILNLMPDVFSVLRRWSGGKSPLVATGTVCSRQQILAIEKLLGVFYEYHLGETSESRPTVLRLLTEYQPEERSAKCASRP